MKHTLLSATVIALALAASGNALAQSTTLKLGFVNIEPNSSASAMSGPFTPVDALSLKVKSRSTLFFSAAREINEHWEAELALGVPPTQSTPVNNAINGGATTIKLKDSAGLAFQLGATAKLGGPWSITGSWSTARVKTQLTTNTYGIERTADITFHPSVLTIALGYSF
jgi:outer membrane protein W